MDHRPLAVHRAAHLIAGHALGLHLDPAASCTLRPCLADVFDDPRVRAARRAACILAGAEAEVLAFGRIGTRQARADRQRIAAADVELRRNAIARANSILRARWRAVELVARALQAGRFVDVRMALRVGRDGESPPSSGRTVQAVRATDERGPSRVVHAGADPVEEGPREPFARLVADEDGDLDAVVKHLLGDGRQLAAVRVSATTAL